MEGWKKKSRKYLRTRTKRQDIMGSTQDTQHSINSSSRKKKYKLGDVHMEE